MAIRVEGLENQPSLSSERSVQNFQTDGESAQDVLGSDENEENDSEDAKTLEKDDESLESNKEVSKEDTE
ncbi:hypothetical protein LIER_02816 [Lithospermum erythrorhizon]|uniref:Uncharacterized protein n=1 Tax=Lithospermum erythrorhizon TaxID=34254 RepID=A0AAV3NQU7_LITER